MRSTSLSLVGAMMLHSITLAPITTHGFVTPTPSTHSRLPLCPTQESPTTLNMNKKKGSSKSTPRSSSGGGFGKKATTLHLRTKSKPNPTQVYAGSLRPYPQSPQRTVDPSLILSLPDYAIDGQPKKRGPSTGIEIKSRDEIEHMRAAGRVAREVLDIAGSLVAAGVTTDRIDEAVHEACIERKAYPSPLNYRKFPKSCCTSVNEVICHGIPDARPLEEGDIVNIDITCYLDGYHGDCSEMFVVGGPEALDDDGRRLIQTTYDAWIQSMELVKPGVDYNAIGKVIQNYIEPKGYSTVRSFCGHGIGATFHTAPNIYHYTVNQPLGSMEPGHVFTIEPMICEGLPDPYMWSDDWTATTVDGKRSAQFEHSLLVTEDGVEALTGKLEGSPLQFWERESEFHKGIWLGTSQLAKERAGEINRQLELS